MPRPHVRLRNGKLASGGGSGSGSGGGAREFIKAEGVSNGAIEFTDAFASDDGYSHYELVFQNVQCNGDMVLRFSDDGGATYYDNQDYFWSRRRSGSGGGGSNDGPAGLQNQIRPVFNTDADNDPQNGVDGKYLVLGATENDRPTRITGTNVHFANDMTTRHWNFSGGGMMSSNVSVDSVKITADTGLVGGEIGLYGIQG